MTVSNDTAQRVTLVAVDIAKDSHDVLIESPTRGRRRRLRLANNLEDFEQLAGYLRSLKSSLKSSVLIGFEATGNYHRPLAYFLHEHGFELRLIPTLALARTREAMHNSWDKNDPKDAQVILHLLKTGLAQTWHDPVVKGINDVQELSKTHFQVTLARVRVWHTLRNHYFALYFPEIDRFIRSDHSVWLVQLLASFPTPASITALSEEEFQAQAWNLVGRKVSKRALLAEIYAAAGRSIGVPVPLDSASVAMFRLVLGEYLDLHRLWRAPRKIPRIVVEFVTRRRRTDEREPVQRRTNHRDFARGGGRAENCRSMSPARDRRSDTVQVESEVWRYGSGRRQAA